MDGSNKQEKSTKTPPGKKSATPDPSTKQADPPRPEESKSPSTKNAKSDGALQASKGPKEERDNAETPHGPVTPSIEPLASTEREGQATSSSTSTISSFGSASQAVSPYMLQQRSSVFQYAPSQESMGAYVQSPNQMMSQAPMQPGLPPYALPAFPPSAMSPLSMANFSQGPLPSGPLGTFIFMPQNFPSLNPPDFVDGEPPLELEKNCPMSARTATVLAVSAIVALLYLLFSEDSAGFPIAHLSSPTPTTKLVASTKASKSASARTSAAMSSTKLKVAVTPNSVARAVHKALKKIKGSVKKDFANDDLKDSGNDFDLYDVKFSGQEITRQGLPNIVDFDGVTYGIDIMVKMNDAKVTSRGSGPLGFWSTSPACTLSLTEMMVSLTIGALSATTLTLKAIQVRKPLEMKCEGFRHDSLRDESAKENLLKGLGEKYIDKIAAMEIEAELRKALKKIPLTA